jgi:hypothetical protein
MTHNFDVTRVIFDILVMKQLTPLTCFIVIFFITMYPNYLLVLLHTLISLLKIYITKCYICLIVKNKDATVSH